MIDYQFYAGLLIVGISCLVSLLALALAGGAIIYQTRRRRLRTSEELDAFAVVLSQNQKYFDSQMTSMSQLNYILAEVKRLEMMIASNDEKLEDIYGKIADLTAVLLKRFQ